MNAGEYLEKYVQLRSEVIGATKDYRAGWDALDAAKTIAEESLRQLKERQAKEIDAVRDRHGLELQRQVVDNETSTAGAVDKVNNARHRAVAASSELADLHAKLGQILGADIAGVLGALNSALKENADGAS